MMPRMPKKPQRTPMSLRLTPELDKRLEEMAGRLGIKKHTLAKMAVEAAVEAIEQNDYRIVVPIQFAITRAPAVAKYSEHQDQSQLAADAPLQPGTPLPNPKPAPYKP